MYERSAIVLERYFENFLGYRKEGNIRDNFNNYCELVEKLEKYQINYEKELNATEEFEESLKNIKSIQASQKKLYEKSVKLEYNRNLMFNNIEGTIEQTRKCIEKIESDVEKNNKEMLDVKESLMNALAVYNEKRFELSKCKRYKKIAEKAYNEAYEIAVNNYDSISQDMIDIARAFENFEDAEEIISELENNGKNEKIPFNEDVIKNATMFGLEIAKKEVASYLIIYDKMTKILSDIEEGATKIELHKKYARNEKIKIDFIYAVKDYMTQFLDYERMTIIHGRKSHNRLMSEACENFESDVIQINNLFELLVKEIANKTTKKAYKELYNKSYLIDIQEKDEKFKREKNRVNLNTATLINSNYWRIEGIKEIFTIFYKTVTEILGRNVDEFDVISVEEYKSIETVENETQEAKKIEVAEEKETKKVEKVKKVVEKQADLPFEIEKGTNKKAKAEVTTNKNVKKVTIEQLKKKVSADKAVKVEKEEKITTEKIKVNKTKNKEEKNQLASDSKTRKRKSKSEKIEVEDNKKENKLLYTEDMDDFDEESDYNSADDMINGLVQSFQAEAEDDLGFDIFGEKYQNIDVLEKLNRKDKKSSRTKDIMEDSQEDEESLFTDIKLAKVGKVKNEIQDINIDEEPEPYNVLKKVKKISKLRKSMTEEN